MREALDSGEGLCDPGGVFLVSEDVDVPSKKYSVKEAAKLLGLSEKTIRREIEEGVLQAEKVPRPGGFEYRVEIPDDTFPGGWEGGRVVLKRQQRSTANREDKGRRVASTSEIPARLIKLNCPGCGARLEVARASSQFICEHCGSQYVLSRGTGALEITPILEHLDNIETATSRGAEQTSKVAMELELVRLERELPELKKQLDGYIKALRNTCMVMAIVCGGIAGLVSGDGFWAWMVGCAFLLLYMIGKDYMHRDLRLRIKEMDLRIAYIRTELGAL